MSDPSADSPPPPPPPNTDSDSPTPLFPPQRTHVRVATTGNIHLSVKSQKGEFLYEVSSHILSESSPVFRRMFATDSPFLEGQLLSDAQTTGVKPAFSLPEDDPDALLIILRILHLKHSSLPANVGFETMVELAILADKYELVEALQFWVAKWTTLFGCPMETVGEENWLVVCSIFQLSQLGDLVKVVAWRSYGSDKGDGELIFKKPGVLAEPTEYSLHPCLKEETLSEWDLHILVFTSELISVLRVFEKHSENDPGYPSSRLGEHIHEIFQLSSLGRRRVQESPNNANGM